MRKFYLKQLLTALLLLCSAIASAHDFKVGAIYYDITDAVNKTVAVTYRGSSSDTYSNEYSGAVTIPSSVTYNGKTYRVTSIGNEAFALCNSLANITIPNSVTSIGEYAFEDCSSLTSIKIPNNVTSIGSGAFALCNNLASVTISGSVTSIEDYAFFGCWSLTSITIPKSVTSIGNSAFASCSSLTSIKIPNSVTSIGSNAFALCTNLESITIPNSVTSIGNEAFFGCWSLKSITIPKSVTSIGNEAFSECWSLTSITIPKSVTSIGNEAFYKCDNITAVYSESATPPVIKEIYTFSNTVYKSATLYVPIGAKAAYEEAQGWKKFVNIVEMDFTAIGDIEADGTAGSDAIYNLNCQRVENPTKGIYIVNGKKVVY